MVFAKKTVLMFCAIPSQLPTLLPIARLLNNTKQYKPIVVFDLSFQENLILVRTCLNYGLTCVDYRNPYALLENDVYFTRRSTLSYSEVNGRARILEQYLPERIQRFFRVFRLITNYIKMIKKLVSYYKPIANIIPYETVGYFFDSVPLIAGRKRITTIIVPFCFVKKQTTAEWLFNKTPEKRTSVFISKLVNLAWPQWGMQYKNRLMLRESLPWIIASELLGIAKPNPWIDNDGYSDIIAIESSYMEKCYISEGVNISKVRIIGSLRHDEMYRAFIDQESIRKTLLIESKFGELLPKRWVLISLPEVFSFSDRVCEFNTHEEICEALIRPVLNKEDILAIISLHPRLPIEQVSHLQRKNIYISTRSITELLPCCDVFATVSSAAISLAISCGVPVVEYDVFHYNDDYYKEATGVITVSNYAEYESNLSRVIWDEDTLRKLTVNQQAVAKDWGILDGCAGERLIDLLQQCEASS